MIKNYFKNILDEEIILDSNSNTINIHLETNKINSFEIINSLSEFNLKIKQILKENNLEKYNFDFKNNFYLKYNEVLNDFEKGELLYSFLFEHLIKANGGELIVKKFILSFEDKTLTVISSSEKIANLIKKIIDSNIKLFNNVGILFNDSVYLINKEKFLNKENTEEDDFYNKNIFQNSNDQLKNEIKENESSFKSTKTSITYNLLTKDDLDKKQEINNIIFKGKIFAIEEKKYSSGKGKLFSISIYNPVLNKSINSIKFSNNLEEVLDFKINDFIEVGGNYKKDNYSKDENSFQIIIRYTRKIEPFEDQTNLTFDKNLLKERIELSVHTSMSTMDGIGGINKYIDVSKKQKVKQFVVTDTNSVQSYPDAYNLSKNDPNIKINYGLELEVIDDINSVIVRNERDQKIVNSNIVFFDIESTGLSSFVNEMIEFGATKIENGDISDFDFFVKPKNPIPIHIQNLTHITNNDVKNGKTEKEALIEIKKYFGDSIIVAHNADFDIGFINNLLIKNNMEVIKNPVIDSLKLSWLLNPDFSRHTLGTLAKKYNVIYDEFGAHRADYDANVLSKVFEQMLYQMKELNIKNLLDINKHIDKIKNNFFSSRVNLIAKNQKGLKEIYQIVSLSHIEHFNSKKSIPTLPLSVLLEYKKNKNLLIGSNSDLGFLWSEINNGLNKEFFLDFFDYYEINPLESYTHLIENNYFTEKQLILLIKEIINLAKKNKKLFVLSGNVYYPSSIDYLARSIYIMNKGIGGRIHRLYPRNKSHLNFPKAHLKNSLEIENELSFLDANTLDDLIYKNPEKLLKDNEEIIPLKDGLFTPKIENSREDFVKLINQNLVKKYGENVHPLIKERLDKELKSIIGNGFDIIYYLSSLAVRESLKNGYLVGSRGSVGSSFVATLSEITEVNPLPAHYYCSKCKTVEFIEGYDSGFDLKNNNCPRCKGELKGEGNNIPFETFLGFKGEKVPDIDLNFSGEYQLKIHDFIKRFLGEKNVFRAGTISTVAKKTAYGYILNYLEQTNLKTFQKADIDYLSLNVEGTKRTTGQHPGGLIIVPNYMDIYDFTPINFPGNDIKSDWKTTHFDFHSIHDNLLKLDFLGHIDPTVLKMLFDLTKIDPKSIYLGDENVLKLFEGTKPLKIKKTSYFAEELGILGIPEFGTTFVRELVKDAKPKTFSDLIRISGLSHGTDVWLGNAKELILSNTAKLEDVICVRDDIMTYLISKGLSSDDSFAIMEQVRKGKSINSKQEKEMKKNNVPSWYIESCKKIKYMFPKAHATAYVMMAFRIAWYKINYPLEYYATYFTKRDTEWDWYMLFEVKDSKLKTRPIEKIYDSFLELKEKQFKNDKEKMVLQTMEIVFEMYARGFEISIIDVSKSKANVWGIDYEKNSLIPPFNIIEGLGDVVAQKIEEQAKLKPYISIDDFNKRSGINKTQLKFFEENKIINSLPKSENNQYIDNSSLKQKSFF